MLAKYPIDPSLLLLDHEFGGGELNRGDETVPFDFGRTSSGTSSYFSGPPTD
jgi:hypothetical protein